MSHLLQEQTLLEKLRDLPADRIGEVEDFADFLCQRDEDKRRMQSAARLSEPAFKEIWDNYEDDDL